MATTVGQILVNDCLPPKFRDYGRVLDSNGIEDLLRRVASEAPEEYSDVSKKLMDVGGDAAFDTGVTLRLADCETKFDKRPYFDIVDQAEDAIEADKTMSYKDKMKALGEVYDKVQGSIQKSVMDAELKAGNQLALQVASKARGSPGQLMSFISTPGTFPDNNGNTVPMFIRHSFAEGLTPAEYWAGSYGARTSTTTGKMATAKGGAFGKLLSQSANNQVIVTEDCGGTSGVPMPISDDDNMGALLAQKTGKYPAGTIITKSVLADLRKDKKLDEIVIRSPMTCGCKSGVCSKCAGVRETGGLPPIGYNLGTNAASAFAERITQGALNTKHCLAEGTLVRMADWSVKPIEEIKIGDSVIGSDINGRLRPVKVLATFDNGYEECVRTEFTRLKSSTANPYAVLDSTEEHKILGFVKNGAPCQLKVGCAEKSVYACMPSGFDDTGAVDEPMALLIGALIGDGCYTEAVTGVHLSCSDEREIEDINTSIAGLNISLHRLKYHNGIYYRVSMPEGSYDAGGNPVKNFLIENGMYGKYAHDKDIPPIVGCWNNSSVASLIGGLIAADGSVYISGEGSRQRVGISFASTSRALLEHVRGLLRDRFGISSSNITLIGRAGTRHDTFKRNHDQYQITITSRYDVLRFHEKIFIPGVKQLKLSSAIESGFVSSSTEKSCLFRNRQESIGVRHVYDIMVDCPDHLFLLANGLIVSNSGRLASGAGQYQGFAMFTSMAKVPKSYPDKATISSVDGEVTAIKDAPQGGKYVIVNDGSKDSEHYVPTGYDIMVKPGDRLEAGDQISDGVINPAELVQYKGIGEARKYWAQRFTQGIRDSGMKGNRRNAEVLAKTLINNVELDEECEAGFPGDVTTYTKWAYGFKPRRDSKMLKPEQANGMYLEQPVLHYTIGTRITPSVVKTLSKFGHKQILVNQNMPGAIPFMQRVEDSNAVRDDWMARLGTTYLKDRIVEDAQRGAESHLHSTEPNPGLAKGVEFGNWGKPGSRNRSPEFTY